MINSGFSYLMLWSNISSCYPILQQNKLFQIMVKIMVY